MSHHSRSPDDLPLAAYTTGIDEDEDVGEPESASAPQPMDARAAALSIVEPPVAALDTDPPPDSGQSHSSPARTLTMPALRLPALGLPRDATSAARDPRVFAAGAIVIGVLLVAASLGRGLTSGAVGPGPSASPSPAVEARTPGVVSITLSGDVSGDYSLTGSAGLGRPTDNRLASTWTDGLGSSLAMTGLAASGTRPTEPDLVLTWTVLVKGSPVTFTSRHGECVVGMAVKPTTVSGSIVCQSLRSDDGKLVVGLSGSYRT